MQRSFFHAAAGQLVRSFLSPAPREKPVHPLRALVGLPMVFDAVSFTLQTIDHGRTRRIKEKFGADDPHHREVQTYNANVTITKVYTSTRRIDFFYKLLALPPRDLTNERLLIVGPRNRHELLAAWVHGFKWSNIDAIDLFSTHPKICVMNMEAMTWPDASFDAVSMANTLSYAEDTRKAISEVARVLKPGGRFAFSITYVPEGKRWKEAVVPAGTIADFLHECGFEIELHQAFDKTNSSGLRQTSHALLARKIPPEEQRLDPFRL